MKTNILLCIFLFALTNSFGQGHSCSGAEEHDSGLRSSLCSYSSAAYLNKYRLQSFYKSNSTINTEIPIKEVKVNLHIIQKSNPSDRGNFEQDNPTHQAYLNRIFSLMNNLLQNNPAPTKPIASVCNTCITGDTRIRIVRGNTYYHENDLLWSQNTGGFNMYKQNSLKEINIFFYGRNGDGSIGGNANLSDLNLNKEHWVNMVNVFEGFQNSPHTCDMITAQLTLHELAHNFGLLHTYQPTCCHESCDHLLPPFSVASR
jgi:hypothetical protein